MSLPRYEKTYSGKTRIAIWILQRIAPLIMDTTRHIELRISRAKTWCQWLYLEKQIQDPEYCNDKNWTEETLEEIAKKLIKYAHLILTTQ